MVIFTMVDKYCVELICMRVLVALITQLMTYLCVCVVCVYAGRCDQSFALVGDQVFMFGGFDEGGEFSKDLYVLNTGKH